MDKPENSQPPAVVLVPAATRRRRWVTGPVLIVGSILALLVALGIGGLAVLLAINPDGPPFSRPVRMAAPLELAPVMSQSTPPCVPGSLPAASGGTCYNTGPGMLVNQVRDIETATDPTGDHQVTITLEKRDVNRLAQMTREAVDQPIAFILQGQVITAATVEEPITAGGLTISGLESERAARDLVDRLTAG